MSTQNSERLGPAPLKSLNAFSLPRLKTDIAKKFANHAEVRPTSNEALEDTENQDKDANPPACLEQAASLSAEPAANDVATNRQNTVRKSKRQARSRPSEITVYYDALQSPDDANTVTKHKSRIARAGRASAKQLTDEAEHIGAVDMTAEALPQGCDAEVQAEQAEHKPLKRSGSDHSQHSLALTGISHGPQKHSKSESCEVIPAAATTCRRRSKNSDKTLDVAASAAADGNREAVEQQQQLTRAVESLRDGQEIFKYMQQLAEDAAGLLPQDEDQEQKKRGRGRAKKDLRLVDALHQSWNGKSYYERLQELTRHEIEQEEQQTTAAGPEYRPLRLSAAAPAPAADEEIINCSRPSSDSQPPQDAGLPANTRKRRTVQPGSRSIQADRDTEQEGEDAVTDAEAVEVQVPADTSAAAGGPSKRRATQGTTATSRAAASAPRTRKPSASSTGPAANKARCTTSMGTGAAAVTTASASRSPFPGTTAAGNRPPSSRSTAALTCEFTPAAAATAAGGLAERPPWSIGGPVTGGAAGGTGATAGTGAVRADRSAVQKLQTALDAKTDELTAVKDQLEDLQDVVAKLRAEQKAHPKALAQLEKQKQTLEKKVEAAERKQTVLERENEGLQERLAKQEAEKLALQEQLMKSDKEVKALRAKLKQTSAKLEKCQVMGQKLQEMGATLAAEAQPVWME